VTVAAATGAASGVGGVKVGCGLWVAAVAGVATAVSSLGWVLLVKVGCGLWVAAVAGVATAVSSLGWVLLIQLPLEYLKDADFEYTSAAPVLDRKTFSK
jgi:hypothetical protein